MLLRKKRILDLKNNMLQIHPRLKNDHTIHTSWGGGGINIYIYIFRINIYQNFE